MRIWNEVNALRNSQLEAGTYTRHSWTSLSLHCCSFKSSYSSPGFGNPRTAGCCSAGFSWRACVLVFQIHLKLFALKRCSGVHESKHASHHLWALGRGHRIRGDGPSTRDLTCCFAMHTFIVDIGDNTLHYIYKDGTFFIIFIILIS